jgi:hypothetical protein
MKYSEGDIFIHREFPNEQRKIIYSYYENETAYYIIRNIVNNKYSPSPIEEGSLDKYYILSIKLQILV